MAQTIQHFNNIIALLPGLLGSLVSIQFLPKPVSKIEAFFCILTGTTTSVYLTPAVLTYYPLHEDAQFGMAFLLGFLGMVVLEAIMNIAKKAAQDPINFLKGKK